MRSFLRDLCVVLQQQVGFYFTDILSDRNFYFQTLAFFNERFDELEHLERPGFACSEIFPHPGPITLTDVEGDIML